MNLNKKKIIHITVRADFGGGPEHISRLSKQLLGEFDFYFAAPNDFPYYDRYSQMCGSEKLITIPHRKFKIKTLIELIKFVNTQKIDIVHSHGKGAGIYGRLLGAFTKAKVVHTFHGLHIGSYNSIQKSLYLFIEKILSLFTDAFINVSAGENELIRRYKVANKNKLRIINNGVEIPTNIVSPDMFDQTPKTIITFTRFDYQKNTELLISIILQLKKINRIDKFNFIVLGSGPNEEHIKNIATKNNLNDYIHFPGPVLETDQYIINSFCYISTSRWEGLPLGVLEAFAHGLPVIATNVVGNKDVIDNNVNGILYNINEPDEAAEQICRIADNKEEWLMISKNARAEAELNYSVAKMAIETKQVYIDTYKKD